MNKYSIFLFLIIGIMIIGCTDKIEENNTIDTDDSVVENPLLENPRDDFDFSGNIEITCIDLGGIWLNGECEGINEDECSSLGGEFNPCASACRNDPNSEICTKQCIILCSFKENRIMSFEDCEKQGYPVMESFPRKCIANEETFTEQVHICTEEEKNAQICTMDYRPVCGSDGITYGNGCSACTSQVEYWIEGEC
jgi:hypothetical protein